MKSPLYRESGTGPVGGWEPPSKETLQAILPAYEFLGLIGCGGMGAVYHARQRSLRRSVAVKILPRDLLDHREAHFADRFRREALTLARLNHPGIVAAIESGEAGGFLYLVMEHVDGPDVARLLRDSGKLAPEVAVSIAMQTAEALAYAHASGVIHRDIKPGNILVTRDGQVKITDFGLACRTQESQPDLTRTDVAVGTADYLAPESLRHGRRVDARADIYSLGVTLFQMLSGSVPRGRWKMPSRSAGVDSRIDDILRRTLASDPDQRYPDSTTLLRDLEAIRAGLPPTPAEMRRQRHRAVARWAPVVSLALAALLGLAFWRSRKPVPLNITVPIFSERNGWLEVPHFGARAPTDEMTIEFWSRPTAFRGQAIFELIPNDDANQCRFLLNGHGGLSHWEFGSAVTEGHLAGPTPANFPGQWTHYALVVSRKANRMQIFTNGVLHAEKQGMSSRIRREAALRIGGDTITFRGALADFRVWNHARTARQIQSERLVQPAPDAPGLVLHYPLNGGPTSVVTNQASATGPILDGTFPRPLAWTHQPIPGHPENVRPRQPPQTWIVRSSADDGPETLRSLLSNARAEDRIRFDPALSGHVLRLTRGPLPIATSVDIDARDLPLGFTIDAQGQSSVVQVAETAIVRIAGLTFTNGSAIVGGGILNNGWLDLEDCNISGNQASHDGGGLYSYLDTGLRLTRCTIRGNKAADYGGGIWIGGVPGAELTECILSGNESQRGGSAMVGYFAPLRLIRCTLTNNIARKEGSGGILLDASHLHLTPDSILTNNTGPVSDPIVLVGNALKVDLLLPAAKTGP